MTKPSRSFPRPLSELLGATLSDILKAQGFASTEIISRWADIAGPEIAAHSEPLKITWPRAAGTEDAPSPQRSFCGSRARPRSKSSICRRVILERVNRFFGWQAVGRIAIRQAPLRRARTAASARARPCRRQARIAEGLPEVKDDDLRQAHCPPRCRDQAKLSIADALAGRPGIATIILSS